MIQKNLKLISLTTVLAGLLFFSTPLNANADEKKDTTSDEAIMKKALLVINGFEEDGKTAREGKDIVNNIVGNFVAQGRKERRTMMVILTERNKHRQKRG